MATAICLQCGKEWERGNRTRYRFCSYVCESAHYRDTRRKYRELVRGGMSDAEARKAVGLGEKKGQSKKVSTKSAAKEEREARARRLAERDAAYAREFSDCVDGEWRGQRRIGMFSGLRKAVEG